jgi:hypothetical protein
VVAIFVNAFRNSSGDFAVFRRPGFRFVKADFSCCFVSSALAMFSKKMDGDDNGDIYLLQLGLHPLSLVGKLYKNRTDATHQWRTKEF